MNFGYPFTPYNTPENMIPNYPNQTPVNNQMVPFYPDCGCSCGNSCGYNQVVNKCFVEEVPYQVNYHTHVVNNVVRRHIQIPVYSTSEQTVYHDEWEMGCGCGCGR